MPSHFIHPMHDFGWLGRESTGSMSCSRLVWAVWDDKNLACLQHCPLAAANRLITNPLNSMSHVIRCLQFSSVPGEFSFLPLFCILPKKIATYNELVDNIIVGYGI
jgi:hypothetical protein